MEFVEKPLGTQASFLLPSLKLKGMAENRQTFEQRVHSFLTREFQGYTAAAGNLFGYWKDNKGEDSYGEHRQFSVALKDQARLPALKEFLSKLADDMHEECICLETGGAVILIYGATSSPPQE